MPDTAYLTASDAFAAWRDDLLSGKPPVLFPVGINDLARIEVGPGLVTLVGGAPGAGKTAFTMQAVVDALRGTPDLKAVVCNVEMTPAVLLDRQLARLSGIDLTTIRHRRLTSEHADRLDQALNTLEPLAERLAFVRPPFSVGNVAQAADDFEPGLILIDYIQRLAPHGKHGDKRGEVNSTMDHLRRFADRGVAVVVVSAVGRTKDAKGRSTYTGDGLTLASFRESSELEYGADDAFILTPGDDARGDAMTLLHLKSRHGECCDIALTFDRKRQRFTSAGDADQKPDPAKVKSAAAALWAKTKPAGDDDQGAA